MNNLKDLIEEFLRYLLIDKGYSNNTIESYIIVQSANLTKLYQ